MSALDSNPAFAVKTCVYVVVTCSTCGREFNEDEEGTVGFDSREEAVGWLTEAGWWLLADGVQCDRCAGEQACREFGHAWEPWRRCGCRGQSPGLHRLQQMQVRWCESCEAEEERPEPEGGVD